jgi:3-deoxy-manno-octulosonate cytidylyltransferase (CMP-KDO synthetase)
MKATAIIPARLASTRFPGKVLADATGRPLIAHVCEAAGRAGMVERVVVATDDERVAEAVRAFGGEVVMTGEHPNGSSRLAEAADRLGLADDRMVVNVQGDEPEIDPAVIDAAVTALVDSGADASTIASPIRDEAEASDPNVVKVVVGRDGRALYFSRARIPHDRDGSGGADAQALRHVGLYCYTAGFLRRYVRLPEGALERSERLEQLRILEHGHSIAVAVRETAHAGIDTPGQYEAFVRRETARRAET